MGGDILLFSDRLSVYRYTLGEVNDLWVVGVDREALFPGRPGPGPHILLAALGSRKQISVKGPSRQIKSD